MWHSCASEFLHFSNKFRKQSRNSPLTSLKRSDDSRATITSKVLNETTKTLSFHFILQHTTKPFAIATEYYFQQIKSLPYYSHNSTGLFLNFLPHCLKLIYQQQTSILTELLLCCTADCKSIPFIFRKSKRLGLVDITCL